MTIKHFEKGRALIIGIGPAYARMTPLPAVVTADAIGLHEVLTNPTLCGYNKQKVELLLDAAATKVNIVAGIKRLASEAQSDETVVVFFSGHGARRYADDDVGTYLCPVDFDSDQPRSSGIESTELSLLIDEIPSDRVLVVIDACHSEGAIFFKSDDASKGLLLPGLRSTALDLLAKGKGRVVVSSCREEETSLTYSAKGHSLFTYFLLMGLRGEASGDDSRVIKVFDLFNYLADQVPNCHPRPEHTQHPVIKMHAESNFPLSLRPSRGMKNESHIDVSSLTTLSASEAEDKRAYMRKVEDALVQLYPTGPVHNDLWERAGGSLALLTLGGTGRSMWSSALRQLSLGGGGGINLQSLLDIARDDFANSALLRDL